MATEVFNRHENKFLLDDYTYGRLMEDMLRYMEPDEYNKSHGLYTISNIYFDTRDNELIRKSVSKPRYKEKLRLRAYGVPDTESIVYLEIKKKCCGIVNKRRTAMKLSEAYEFVRSGVVKELPDYVNRQVLNEISYLLKLNNLQPKLYLAYDRNALFSSENRSLRITFDRNIRTRRDDLRLEDGDYGELLLDGGMQLMEVKTEKSIPYWLSELLAKYRVYSTGFSKYGREYQKFVQNNRNVKEEKDICLVQYSEQMLLIPQFL